MAQRQRGPSLFIPILLIGLGVIFLLDNLDIIAIDIGRMLATYWPVILILAGIDLLLGRRSGLGAVLALVVLAALVGLSFSFTPMWGGGDAAETIPIHQTLDGAEQGDITIASGISRLDLTATSQRDILVSGSIAPLRNEEILESFDTRGSRAIYSVRSEGPPGVDVPLNSQSQGHWDLAVSNQLPLALDVSTGMGQMNLDLSLLDLTALTVDCGVGETTVTLPDRGRFDATVSGGVGAITILAPDSLALRVRADAGLGGVSVDGDFERDRDAYVSPGYARADDRVDLQISGGVGSITVRQVSRR